LKVSVPSKAKRRIGTDFELTDTIKRDLDEVVLTANATAIDKRIVDLSFPATINILAIQRGDVYIVPKGSTRLQENDVITVLAEDNDALEQFSRCLGIQTSPLDLLS
ncbi:MAG: sodium/hydrogen exchanger, partial [Chitinophagaceae bacterium]|nr:sodium/hydrogen exchanger [Chitinophagaceae bacterium]